jgi:hypothetical protein
VLLPNYGGSDVTCHTGPPSKSVSDLHSRIAAAPDVPGTTPRTLGYRGPAITTFVAVLIKNIGIRDGHRLEAQNVLNHPVFGDPNTSFGSTSFGQITSTKIGARQMMFGLKYRS